MISIVLIGLAMLVFTYFGGMEAVIWVEVVQLEFISQGYRCRCCLN